MVHAYLAQVSTKQIHKYKVSADDTNHSSWGIAKNSTTAVDWCNKSQNELKSSANKKAGAESSSNSSHMPLTLTIDFEVTVTVTLAIMDMRIVNRSNTVGDEHEHS